ncbi:MAG: NfeD family protein [Pseudomonadota bacterium]
MITQWLADLGVWSWFLLGLLLLIGEIVLPGIFLLWFGLAALVVGGLTLLPFTDVAWWPWQAQMVAFGVLSLIFVLMSQRLFPNRQTNDAAAKMNAPLKRFHGREGVLAAAIESGTGRVKLGDTVWRVKGADLPVGSRVKVVGDDGDSLLVESA